jgi:hypothetical protein
MGKNLFTALVLSVVVVATIDWFINWYGGFLTRRSVSSGMSHRIQQIFWVLLALIFWNSLYRLALPESFDFSYVLFALFIFALRGLVLSFFVPKSRAEKDD